MRMLLFFTLLLCLGLLISCDKDDPIVDPGPMVDMEDPEILDPEKAYIKGTSDYIFDQNKLHRFDIEISESNLKFLDDDPAAEEYVGASLIFEGDTIGNVGLRYKGSIGAFVNCLSGSNIFSPSGSKTCTKLSMKLKVNWIHDDLTFYGLKKLQFHSMNQDGSQMRERLGYWFFREMGVVTSRAVHVKLYINGNFSGVYALIEQIDGRMMRYNYENGKGNLYKEVWPINEDGKAFNDQVYLNALKTNENENPSVALMSSFGQDIENTNVESMKEVVEKWMDVDKIMAYAAVDRTIRVDDGAFHWYCGGVCSNHNYYWYEDPLRQKLHLIPWDMDNTFENIISDANPVTPIADDWGEISNNCLPFFQGFTLQRSAACDKLTAAWVSYEDEYNAMIEQFKNGPLDQSIVDAKLEEWSNQIREATIEASQVHSDAISESWWNNQILNLKNQLEFARNN